MPAATIHRMAVPAVERTGLRAVAGSAAAIAAMPNSTDHAGALAAGTGSHGTTRHKAPTVRQYAKRKEGADAHSSVAAAAATHTTIRI